MHPGGQFEVPGQPKQTTDDHISVDQEQQIVDDDIPMFQEGQTAHDFIPMDQVDGMFEVPVGQQFHKIPGGSKKQRRHGRGRLQRPGAACS